MDDAPKVTLPLSSPSGEPAGRGAVKPAAATPRLQVSVQFGPTPSIPGSRLKGRGK
jgi:hypothetical protein